MTACAGGQVVSNAPDEVLEEPIIGGTLDTADPAVVGLFGHKPGETSGGLCSATLIAPTWVLTAAHCVDPAVAGEGNVYEVFFVNDMHGAPADRRWPVKNVYWDHEFSSTNLTNGHDIGLVELAMPAPADIRPIPYLRAAIPPGVAGGNIRLVGFGLDDAFNQTGAGIKREVTTILQSIGDKTLQVGKTGQTSCNGDSGGPALVTIDGKETLVGVTSYGFAYCLFSGYYTRVDLYTPFIDTYVKDQPCTPDCSGKECDSDGCGGSCGTCDDGETCSPAHTCVPAPAQGCPGETEGNEDPSQANPLCDGNSVQGTVGKSDDNDWFTFPVDKSVTYTVLVENIGRDVAVELYKRSNKSGNLVKVGDLALVGDTAVISRRTADGGKYYVHVYANGFASPASYGLYVVK